MIHSTQVCIPLKPLFSRHKGAGVQFTDEPTGNLDQNTSYEIMEYFRNLNKKYGKTIIMITHDMNLAQNADEIIQIVDGRII